MTLSHVSVFRSIGIRPSRRSVVVTLNSIYPRRIHSERVNIVSVPPAAIGSHQLAPAPRTVDDSGDGIEYKRMSDQIAIKNDPTWLSVATSVPLRRDRPPFSANHPEAAAGSARSRAATSPPLFAPLPATSPAHREATVTDPATIVAAPILPGVRSLNWATHFGLAALRYITSGCAPSPCAVFAGVASGLGTRAVDGRTDES